MTSGIYCPYDAERLRSVGAIGAPLVIIGHGSQSAIGVRRRLNFVNRVVVVQGSQEVCFEYQKGSFSGLNGALFSSRRSGEQGGGPTLHSRTRSVGGGRGMASRTAR
jgi:hypothetical protein